MDQKFGTPTTEKERKLMELVLAEQAAAAQDPQNDARREFVKTLQINAEPSPLLQAPADKQEQQTENQSVRQHDNT